MATTIKIKHKDTDTGPAELRKGELAYAIGTTPTNANGGDKLVIGAGAENGSGVTGTLHVIGGKYFTDMMDHVRGTLTSDSAVLVNDQSEVNEFKAGNFFLNDNVLRVQNASAAGIGITAATDIDLNLTTLRDGVIRYVPTTGGEVPSDSYEARLIILDDDNAIPNKKYVDDAVQSVITGATTLTIEGYSDPLAVLPDSGSGAISLGTEVLKFVGGTGLTVTVNDPQFGVPLTPADVTLTVDADIATAGVDAVSSILGVASFDSANFTVTGGWVESNAITLGATLANLGDTVTDITGLTTINVSNITIDTDTIRNTTLLTDGNIVLSPKGAGVVIIGTLNIDPVSNTIEATNANGSINITPNGTGVVSVANDAAGESRITNVADPINDADAANRRYVDSVAQGLTIRPAARAATTTNLDASYADGIDPLRPGVGATLTANTLVELPVIDGVADGAGIPGATPPQTDRPWAIGDLILVRSQTTQPHNGLYEVTVVGVAGTTAWVLTRHEYVDDKYEIPSSYVFVQEGTTLAGTGWSALVEDFNNFDVGVDDIYWYQFSGAGSVTADNGIAVSGTTVSVRLDPVINSGLEFDGQGDLVIGTVPVANGGTGRNAVTKNALVFGNDVTPGDGLGALGATDSPGSVTVGTGDWNDSNQVPTFDGTIVRWTTTINGGTW